MFKPSFTKIFLLLGLLLTATASQAATPFSLHAARNYGVYLAGIRIGNLTGEIKEEGKNGYRFDVAIHSYGLVHEISKYDNRSFSIFKKAGNFNVIPLKFQSDSKARKSPRLINISYTKGGKIINESVLPPDNRQKRPAVEESLKKSAVDPLTAAFMVRQKVSDYMKGLGESEVTIPMYDGRQLTHLKVTIHGRTQLELKDLKVPAIHFSFVREPVAGYTGNEMKRMETENPPIEVYLSDNDELLPIYATTKAYIGTIVFRLKGECKSLAECEDRGK